MGRRKYQFKDRAEAETAFKKAEREAREMQWFARALVEKRIQWSKKHGGATRFAAFIPNPQVAWSEPLIVEEFKPDTGQAPSYIIYDQAQFMAREGNVYRARTARSAKDPELDGWIEGAREVQRVAQKKMETVGA